MSPVADLSRTTLALSAVGTLGVIYFIVTTVISYRKLRHFNGPLLAAFSELWLFNVTLKGDIFRTAKKTIEKYGSPVRIGPNMIMHDDPEIFRFASAPRSPIRRGHWYRGMKFDQRTDNLVSDVNEESHNKLRAKMMPGYTGKEVPSMESRIDARLLDFIDLIKTECISKGAEFDFSQKVQYFTLDSLTDIAFGFPFGFITQNKDLYDYNKASTAFFPIMELGTNIPWVWSVLSSNLMQTLAGPKPEDKTGFGAIMGVAQDVVKQRFAAEKDAEKADPNRERDMLDAFIKHGLSQVEAESESMLQILAGSDSTATTIRMTLLFLLTNPPAYATLRKEIDTAIAESRISYPVIKSSEAQQLPYLQACIKEVLRLWPPLNGIVTKDSPNEDLTINGVLIPANTQITFSAFSMMRRKDIFGDDAEFFRPGRWIGIEPEEQRRLERVWELSFGFGRFTCLGKGVALMELNKIFVELLRRFDIALVNPINTVETRCHQIHVQKNMNIRVWERQN